MSAQTSAATPDPHPGRLEALAATITQTCTGVVLLPAHAGQLTCVVAADQWSAVARLLRDGDGLKFESCVDVCGMDYLGYGKSEWETTAATESGFSRGVARAGEEDTPSVADGATGRRFAVVYNLLSVSLNQRVRVRVYCPDDGEPVVDSVCGVWAGVNWFEREAFDLFGILFRDHPDLRRLLTDYGFIGHPFRKDFPLSGNVEVRYDPQKGRVIYQPVTIEARVLVPKVIRHDNRYDAQLISAKPNG
jgi:NADH-quinone oxidoreductase subunit C